jgi:hypothetical protein
MMLLRDGMMLLGHWPHDSSETQPSPDWHKAFQAIMGIAARMNELHPTATVKVFLQEHH